MDTASVNLSVWQRARCANTAEGIKVLLCRLLETKERQYWTEVVDFLSSAATGGAFSAAFTEFVKCVVLI